MIAAWLNKLAGTNISYVPYTQMTQGMQDVIAGRVQLVIIAVPAAKGHIAAGKLKALAVTSSGRLPEFPDVQAVAETFPGFDFAGWFALAAPTGVPSEIVTRVNREMDLILKDPGGGRNDCRRSDSERMAPARFRRCATISPRSTRPGERWCGRSG